jgi:hypothetical protein
MVAVSWRAPAGGGGGAPMKMQFLVNLAFGLDGHNVALHSRGTDSDQVVTRCALFKVS